MIGRDRLLWASRSCQDFFRRASPLPTSAPGTTPHEGKAFERLTQLYLKTHLEYQTKLRSAWRAMDELPPPVRRRIDLPRTDEGIDLSAEAWDGELRAIQSTFRADARQPLTVTDLAIELELCGHGVMAVTESLRIQAPGAS